LSPIQRKRQKITIAQLINQNSFILIAVVVVASTAFVLLRGGISSPRLLVLGLVVLSLLAIWAVMHPRQTQLQGQTSQVRAKIGNGTPVLLEFQSPY
jgi:uncharacterized integral membrane protein